VFFEVPVPLLEVYVNVLIKSCNVMHLCPGLCGVKVLVLSAVASDVCDPGSAHCTASDVH